jgi:hypothetical protein
MLEIYCERLQDLLNEEAMLNSGGGGGRNNNSRGRPLRLREHPESGFYGPFFLFLIYYLILFLSAHFFLIKLYHHFIQFIFIRTIFDKLYYYFLLF